MVSYGILWYGILWYGILLYVSVWYRTAPTRRRLKEQEELVGRPLPNPLASPLRHGAWVAAVLLWSTAAVGLVLTNLVLKAVQ